MRRALSLGLSIVLWTIIRIDAQQPRDNRKPVAAGAGTIAGAVVDAEDSRPLRRARVTISAAELEFARTAITGDEGTFSFEGLPPGRYSVSASKDGHVSMTYGASRPGRPGRAVRLDSANQTARVRVTLPRGSVITGTILGPDGEPAPGVSVMALTSTYDFARGERRVSTAANGSVTTDDRGVYRIFGLAAGTYFVEAVPRLGPQRIAGELRVLTESEVRTALAEVREGGTASRPGIPSPVPPPAASREPRKTVALTPVFYPGTTVQSRAVALDLRAGEVRNGVDIDLEYVPTATVEGMVRVPEGMRVQLLIADADPSAPNPTTRLVARAGDDGRFSFRGIPPGSYTITARAFRSNVPANLLNPEADLWGETGVIVAGDDISGVTVPLKPAITIAGRVAFEDSSLAPPQPGSLRIPLPAISVSATGSAPMPTVLVEGSGFFVGGVIPGTYRLSSLPRGVRSPIGPWWLKSIVVNGIELLDSELDLRESTEEAVVRFGDRASELSGRVHHADGTPMTDGFVVVFASESRFWFHNSRRVAGIRLSNDGRYTVRNLPAGDYRIAVSSDIEVNEWFDPDALRALSRGAIRVFLSENETRVQDLVGR